MLLSLSRQVQCPGTVSCSDLWMENPGRYFVCAAFNSLACWAHSCTSCSSACWHLTTGTLHCGKDGSRLELNLPKTPVGAKNSPTQSPGSWSREAASRDQRSPAAQESAPKALSKSLERWKNLFAEHTGSTAEPEPQPARFVLLTNAQLQTQNKDVNPHFHL